MLRRDDRLASNTYVLEVSVEPGTSVDVRPQPPVDITLSQRVPGVLELKLIAPLVLTGVLIPTTELFPRRARNRDAWRHASPSVTKKVALVSTPPPRRDREADAVLS